MSFRTMDRKYLLTSLVLAAMAIVLTALLQWSRGTIPEELVWNQQQAYVIGVPMLVVLLIARDGLNRALWTILALATAALFGWSALLAGWHTVFATGAMPTSAICGLDGQALDVSPSVLGTDPTLRPCTPATEDIFGLPLPFANLVISSTVAALLVGALLRRMSRGLELEARN